jgi:3-hydroxymyristoyl/3-hydroxydecanoyl-(acyl carrier protein) dehydratase
MTHPIDLDCEPTVILARPSIAGDQIVATGMVNPAAAVFAGHYPTLPVLPAFYPIDCVARILRAMYPDGARFGVLAAVDQARLLSPIVPNDELVFEVTPGPANSCAATITTHRGVALRLSLRYRPEAAGPEPPAHTEPAAADTASSDRTTTTMGIGAIKNVMPHRFPMLLIDRVTGLVPKKWLTTVKAISVTEPWFAPTGPEPGPIEDALPPLIILASWLQSSELLSLDQAIFGFGKSSTLRSALSTAEGALG